jgi:Tol biopolymer transport system component/DNA-binding winged helix-turn-helix (wHTH) protein
MGYPPRGTPVAAEPAKTHDVIQFGPDIELDLRAYQLRRGGRSLKLERQPMDILIFLIEHQGELVTREQIADHIWGQTAYLDFDNSINGAIRKIRQVLNDDPENPLFVQTIMGRGYRFIAPVTEQLNGDDNKKQEDAKVSDHTIEVPPLVLGQASGRSLILAGRSRAWMVAVLLVVAASGVILVLRLKQPRRAPFEAVKTYRLTSTGKVSKAVISPDGRYVAHTVLLAGQESLHIRQAKMLNDIEIVPPRTVRYLGITFSNDSEKIYYVARSRGDEPGTLYRIGAMGGASEKIKPGLDSPVTFSPDGKRYAFVRETANESSLVLADLDSGNERTLVSRKLPLVLDYPAWSPDGRVIAFSEYDSVISNTTGSNARILGVNVADSVEQPLSKQVWGNIKKIAWLRDGSGLVLSGRAPVEGDLLHLWYVAYPEATARQITEGLNREVEASVSADSRQIIAVQQNTLSSIWRTDSHAQNPELIVSGESGSSGPVWTPDGRIIFEEDLQGQRSIWSVDADGKNRKQLLPEGNSYDHSVSSSGGKLAFISDRNGVPAVWAMDIDGGNLMMAATPSGEPASDGTAPQISPDGKWIAFTSVGSGHWTALWKVTSQGGKPVELNDKLWLRPAISPDGKWIAGFYDDRRLSTQTYPTSIAIIGGEGGEPSKVIPIPASVLLSGGIRWSGNSREMFYINRGQEGDNIWSQPVNGSAAHQVTHFQGLDLFSFDWSPDGKQLAFSRGVKASDVILVEDTGRN